MSEFLKNTWYVASWSYDLGEAMLARRILDIPLVLFRDATGAPKALRDRCPHRFAPLSKGFVREGNVVCGYHGLVVTGEGACVSSPFNKSVPANVSVQSFPVVERHTAIWIWMGDKAAADPSLIPDYSTLEVYNGPQGYMHMNANYLLAIDNLMDLSHIEFVHKGTFGGAGAFFSGEHAAEVTSPTSLWSRWWMPDVDPPTPARANFPPGAKVTHWQDMHWQAPSHLKFELGFAPPGTPRAEREAGRIQAHILTPETSKSTHYFYSRHNMTIASKESAGQSDILRIAFEEEDRPMMEAVQANMERGFWDEKPMILECDRAAIMARRILAKLIAEENNSKSATA